MISTSFEIRAFPAPSKRRAALWALAAFVPTYIAVVVENDSLGGFLLLGPVVSAIPAIIAGTIAVLATKRQTITTTLESDGVKIWAFNERRPDVAKQGRCRLWSLPLDEVGGVEIADAQETFGINSQIGAGVGSITTQKDIAIIVRHSGGLSQVAQGRMNKATSFQIIEQVTAFLDDARNLSVSGGADPAASSSGGFDL